jgi:hypothetical protein
MFQNRSPSLAVSSLADRWIVIFLRPLTARRIVRAYLLTGPFPMRWTRPVLHNNEIGFGRRKQMNRWRERVFGQRVMDGLFNKRRWGLHTTGPFKGNSFQVLGACQWHMVLCSTWVLDEKQIFLAITV